MNRLPDYQPSDSFPPKRQLTQLAESAHSLWLKLEEFSDLLWNIFDKDFLQLYEIKENTRQHSLSDSDAPF